MSGWLQGRTAVITGASRGLGRAMARRFVAEGASVVLCARSGDELVKLQTELMSLAAGKQAVEILTADISRPQETQAIAARALATTGRVDVLVNNAGIYGPMGNIEEVDWADWQRTFEVNLNGSVLMARAVLPAMKAQKSGKIIQVSGGGATNPMPRLCAYAASKAAVVRFAESLALELAAFGIDVNAMAPGALNTAMLDEVLEAGPDKVGKDFYERSLKQKDSGGAGMEAGCELAVFLASAKSDGITGRLISALWDKYGDWPAHIDQLQRSDVYTLRRLTGRDRGLPWGDK